MEEKKALKKMTKPEDALDVGTIEHLSAISLGAVLMAIGLTRRGLPGALAKLGGTALLVRGLSGYEPVYRKVGLSFCKGPSGTTRKAFRAEASVDVRRPAADLYRLWRDFENLPSFMSHLIAVRNLEGNRSAWVARGPAGTTVHWEAEVIRDEPDEVISWQTIEGSSVDHAGSVHFEALESGLTRVRVVLRYDPPANKLGEAVAKLLHTDPQSQIEDDLYRFKKMINGLTRAEESVKLI